jgi:hypothetical protein
VRERQRLAEGGGERPPSAHEATGA